MKKFVMKAYGDEVYCEATDDEDAFMQLQQTFGSMPRDIVSIDEVDEIPKEGDRI